MTNPPDRAHSLPQTFPEHDERPEVIELFAKVKAHAEEFLQLLDNADGEWGTADAVYRFYHQSFKVFALQDTTTAMAAALQQLAPDRKMNGWFEQIIREGTGKTFNLGDNRRWLEVTRPMLEAYFHAKHFLEMAVRSARELERPPNSLPNSWASILYLFDLR